MAKNEKVVAIDIGATSIKLCEIEYAPDNTMCINVFACREYEDELSESTRIAVVSGMLRQMLAENNIRSKKALISMSGQLALMRFNKIPAGNADRKQLLQLAEFEARRNIPFDIKDVIVDYQLIASENDQELVDVMSVVIKNDIVDQFTAAVASVGLEPILVDVAPVACYNAARANGLGDDGCVAILSIGGRSSNLLFLEGDRFFARTIPIAGYSITQQIVKEFGIDFPNAEELKRHHGFVALGGTYAEPSSETAANVSKIIRNVMARLHGEISRSISIYKAQQKGSAPTKIYLTGGSSILTYCDVFFNEKLNIPVEYLNPFGVVQLADSVDRQQLGEVAHLFSECIGLGLRYRSLCPVEISLLPQRMRRQQNLSSKKPYFFAAMVVVLLIIFAMWQGIQAEAQRLAASAEMLEKVRRPNEEKYKAVEEAEASSSQKVSEYETLRQLLLQRTRWPSYVNEIYRLKPDDVWLTELAPIYGEVLPFTPDSRVASVAGGDSMGMGDMGGMFGGGMDMGGGMMGGGMMGGMGMGMGGMDANAIAEVPTTIAGFVIRGVCVTPYANSRVVAVTETPELAFPYQASEEKSSDESSEEGSEDSDSENVAKKGAKTATTPEYMFLELLRESSLFNPDETLTALTSSQPTSVSKNAGSFEIQVALNEPFEYTRYDNEDISTSTGLGSTTANSNQGTAGGMGGGMMGGGMMGGGSSRASSNDLD